VKENAALYKLESDEWVAGRAAEGSVAAFNELYERYGQKLFSYFFRMLWNNKELAEDCTQELFLKVIKHGKDFDVNRKFSTWFYSIAHNMCKNEYRKAEVKAKYQPVKTPLSVADTEKNSDLQRFRKALTDLLDRMAEEKKQLYVLRFEEQLSVPDISQVMNIPEGTVKSRIFYLLKEMKEQLIGFKTLHIYP